MFDATPLMRGHAALRYFELGAADPAGVQQRVLEKIIERAASTKFGKDHRFAGVDTVHAFQENVPLRRYEDFFHEYWQPCSRDSWIAPGPGSSPISRSPPEQPRVRRNSFRAQRIRSSPTGVVRTTFLCTTF